MNLYEALEKFELILKPNIESFINSSLPTARILAAAIMLIFIGYKVMRYMSNPEDKINPETLVRPILTLMAMVLYIELVKLLLFDPVELVTDIIQYSVQQVTKKDIIQLNDIFHEKITHVQNTGADGNGVYDILQVNPFLEVIHIIIFFISSVVGGYILFKQLILKYIYYVLGVFILPFSLIVGNQKIVSKWFFSFLSVLLWTPVLSIIKVIIVLIPLDTTEFSNILLSIAFQVLMITMVLKVPQFANLLVSFEEGNNIGSRPGGGFMLSGMAVAKAPFSAASKGYSMIKNISKNTKS